MVIETDRLIIRDVATPDGAAFIHMASDGSLNDIGFDKDCSSWMDDWIKEAQNLAREDNPRKNYLGVPIPDSQFATRDSVWLVNSKIANDGAVDLIGSFPLTVRFHNP